MVLSIYSGDPENVFIKLCLKDGQYQQNIMLEPAIQLLPLGGLLYEGTAGELSTTGIEILDYSEGLDLH